MAKGKLAQTTAQKSMRKWEKNDWERVEVWVSEWRKNADGGRNVAESQIHISFAIRLVICKRSIDEWEYRRTKADGTNGFRIY